MAEDLFALGFDTLKGTLDRALKKIEAQADPDRAAVGVAAQGIALAASLMAREFTLVATNVPYLARGKQAEELRDYIADVHPAAKADLATAFVERCLEYCAAGGSTALVTPQNWLFLGSYKALREWLLRQVTWDVVAKLGPAAFEDMNWWAANTMLLDPNCSHQASRRTSSSLGLDVSGPRAPSRESDVAQTSNEIRSRSNQTQLANPDARIVLDQSYVMTRLLSEYADISQGNNDE